MAKSSRGLQLLLISLFIIAVLFLLSPVQLGPVKDFRIMHILKEVGILQEHRTTDQLLTSLKSEDIRVQVDAIMSMSRRIPPDPKLVKVLREFIDSKAPFSLKNLAIYSLGELRVVEALPQLQTRIGDPNYDQTEIKDAIDKITGVKPKAWWKEMF